jgi:hypothetical protein
MKPNIIIVSVLAILTTLGLFYAFIYLPDLFNKEIKELNKKNPEETIILSDSTKVILQGVIQGDFVIQIGKHYTIDLSTDNENDPFRVPDIQEVVVLDIKQGYVLYRYIGTNAENSRNIESFARLFTPKN